MGAGRPTAYKTEYIEQAQKLSKMGATDAEMAEFFRESRSEDEFLACCLSLIRRDRRGVIAARKKGRAQWKARVSTPSSRLLNAVRARMWASLRGKTGGALFSRLPYTLDQLVAHLESCFTEGMNWENYGRWHVDHIKPCAMFDMMDSSQFDECWSLLNLQPLWAFDNIRKGARYVEA